MATIIRAIPFIDTVEMLADIGMVLRDDSLVIRNGRNELYVQDGFDIRLLRMDDDRLNFIGISRSKKIRHPSLDM